MAKETIDCFLIGHNETDFRKYEQMVREMGIRSNSYRDLNFDFVNYDESPYSVLQMYNMLKENSVQDKQEFVHSGSSFSATISYLGSFLNKNNLSFDYVDAFQYEKDKLAEKLTNYDIKAVAITTTLYVTVMPVLEVVEFIQQINPDVKIIVGGPFIAGQVRALTKEQLYYLFDTIGADYYIDSSQGEMALVRIIDSIKSKQQNLNLSNVYVKTGKEYKEPVRKRENNLLEENMIDWSLFKQNIKSHVNIRTAISCPFRCSFCGFPEHAGDYQVVNECSVIHEFEVLNSLSEIKSINIIDDTFNVPVERFKKIMKMMIDKELSYKWHSHCRCQFIDEETVDLMKRSGCEGVFLGLESGSNQILENMNKKTTREKYLKGIKLLKEYDIMTFASFIIGFPGETEKTVQETKQLILDSGVDFYRAQIWYCDTITPIYKQREKYKIEGSNFEWKHNTMDSQKASDIREEFFMNIDSPIYVPQYNFDFTNIFHLLHKGMSLNDVKDFLKGFNNGVREKIRSNSKNNISSENTLIMLNALSDKGNAKLENIQNSAETLQSLDAEFDF